jgi:hypothetical protein
MLKKLFLLILIFNSFTVVAQHNNSWIDYNKTYYKFKVGSDNLLRISQSALNAIGLSTVNANHFQLWRNGKQVRLFTSVSNAPLGPTDFIEFWGEMNDGKIDNVLYRNADFQLTDKFSLETDTAAYFLTVNPTGNNLRFLNAVNTAPSNVTPDAYFMMNADNYYKQEINRGEARPVGEYIYSASYDPGEGWGSAWISPGTDLVKDFTDLYVSSTAPQNSLSVRVNAVGDAPNNRNLKIKLFQTDITVAPYGNDIAMNNFDYQRASIDNLPLSLLQNNNHLQVSVNGSSSNNFDRIVVASIGITYPSVFNFANKSVFDFELTANSNGNYLVIDNFNYGAQAPILLDLTNGFRYIGEIISTPGKVKFVLPPSATSRKYILINQQTVNTVQTFTQRNFIDYSINNNQGDYMIISNPLLYNDGNGNNYVEDYRTYRSSMNGGSYNAKVYDVNELTDQFGWGIKHHPESIRDFIQFASSQFSQQPKYVFIIGRGVNYIDQRYNESNPTADKINLVTTFGWPASDILLSAAPGITTPTIPIGRLSAVSALEVNNYLNKVIDFEATQKRSSGSISEKAWMKNFIHVIGGKDSIENSSFRNYMNYYKSIAEDTLYGAHVETFSKTSTGTVQQASSLRIEELFNEGLSYIGYFGHSSANTFEFNLGNPALYNNP